MSNVFDSISGELEHLGRSGLIRERRVLDSAQSTRVLLAGQRLLAFTSNDYLGLAADSALISALIAGATNYGVGSGASHLVVGHMRPHEEVERALAEFTRSEKALLFSTGYMANLGVVSALAGVEDEIFSDKLNHASMIDGARLSRAKVHVYEHGNIAELAGALAFSKARRKLIITDAVFSMDGNVADIPQLVGLAERHDALLLVDDAHGFGVLGPQGRGSVSLANVSSSRLIYLGTLSKAAGVFGAFISGRKEVIELVLQKARSYIFTTGLPPALASAILCSLKLIEHDDWRREQLQQHVRHFRSSLRALGDQLLPSESHIQGLVLGSNEKALQASKWLADRGLLVSAIRPPTVAPGTARLRITFSATHSSNDIDLLCNELKLICAQ